MGATTTTSLADTVQALYDADYLIESKNTDVWGQVVDWNWKITDDPGTHGSTKDIPVFGRTEPNGTAASEGNDLTPVQMFDGKITLTPSFYHWGMQRTKILDLQGYVSYGKVFAREVARNGVESVGRLIRAVAVGGSYAWRYGGVARTSLVYGTAGHKASAANFSSVMAQVNSRGILGFGDGNSKVAIIHPLMAADLLADTTFLAVDEYGPSKMKGIMNGEVGQFPLMGLRFLSSHQAKLYLSGGRTVTGAATTLNGAIAAGATAATATSGTSFAVGDWVSIGTLESAGTLNSSTGVTSDRHEMVQLLSVSTNDLTFVGIGTPDSATNTGCRFAHADGVALTEAYTVCAVPIMGSESLFGSYATAYGKMPKNFEHEVATHSPGILFDYGWQWYGGFSRHERSLIVAEFAVDGGIPGTN